MAADGRPLAIEVECVAGAGVRVDILVVRRKGITGRVLGKLLLFRMGGGLGILLVEDTKDTGSDLVVDDSFVIFADNVDAKFLVECACCV